MRNNKLISPISEGKKIETTVGKFGLATLIRALFSKDVSILDALPSYQYTLEADPPLNQQPKPQAENVAAKTVNPPFRFDARPYGNPIPQPEKRYADIFRQAFPNEATQAAITAWTESRYNPNAQYTNQSGKYAGTSDRGLFQINDATFADFMNRKGAMLRAIGVNSVNDLYDPVKNALTAKIIRDEQGWNAWYGPKNYGYNLLTKQ